MSSERSTLPSNRTAVVMTGLTMLLTVSACAEKPSTETAAPQNAAASPSAAPTSSTSATATDAPTADPSRPFGPANRTVCPETFFEVPVTSPRGSDAHQSKAELQAAIALLSRPGTSWGCVYTLDGADDTVLTDGLWVRGSRPMKLKKKWSNEAAMVDQLGASARPGNRSPECEPSQGSPTRFVYARRSAAGVAHAVVDLHACKDVRVVSDLGTRDLNHDDTLVDTGSPDTAEAIAELNARMAAG